MTRVAYDPWAILALERGADARTIKRRYAELLKLNRPEDNPEGFQLLRWAYEVLTRSDGHAVEPAPLAPASHAHAEPAPAPEAEPELEAELETEIETELEREPDPPAAPRARPALPEPAPPEFATRVLGVEVPKLRPLNEVVAEIVALGQRRDLDADGFRLQLAGIPELENFESFERVEPVLLERLARDLAVRPPAMQALSALFGWNRYESRDERMHSRHGRWLADAIARAREFEFESQLENGPWLNPTPEGIALQRKVLRDLRAPPRRRAAILAAARYRTAFVQRTIGRYRDYYGVPAVNEVFDHASLMFWHRVSGASPPNVDKLIVQLIQWLAWSCAGVGFVALWVSLDARDRANALEAALVAAAAAVIGLLILLIHFAGQWWQLVGAARWHRFRAAQQGLLYRQLDQPGGVWIALGVALGALAAPMRSPPSAVAVAIAIAAALWFYTSWRGIALWCVSAVFWTAAFDALAIHSKRVYVPGYSAAFSASVLLFALAYYGARSFRPIRDKAWVISGVGGLVVSVAVAIGVSTG